MQRLFMLLRLFREYILLVVFCVASLLFMASSESPQIQVLRTYGISFIAIFQSATDWFSSLFTARAENASLRELNYQLMEEVMQLRRNRFENSELRQMLGLKQVSLLRLVPAEVLGKSVTLLHNTITLNVGTNDGVAVRMPVINEDGLVGRIIAASNSFSIAQLAINRDFRATARVQRSRIDGIIAWNNGDKLLLKNIWKTADIAVGDTIITSEVSNSFPPNVKIGTVSSIGPDPSGMFSRIEVQPSVAFQTIERVFIVTYVPNEERAKLEQSQHRREEVR